MKKFCFLILILFNLFFIDNVFAIGQDWYHKNNVAILPSYKQSSLNGSVIAWSNNQTTNSYGTIFYNYYQSSTTDLNTYFTVLLPRMNSNYAYLVELYMCSSGSLWTFNTSNIYAGDDVDSLYKLSSAELTYRDIDSLPSQGVSFARCRKYSVKLGLQGTNAHYLSLKINNSVSANMYYMGYNFYPLGTNAASISDWLNDTESVISSSTTSIINNQNSQTSTILNNQNSQTTTILNNQNSNNNSIISNQNTNQAQTNSNLNEINNSVKDTNNTLKDSNTTEAEDQASSFFNDFDTDDFGLSSIITLPLEFIQNLSSSTCTQISGTIPFVNTPFTIPCLSTYYNQYFKTIYVLWGIILTGITAYYVCVNIYKFVKEFKDPNNDKIEVMEL